MGAPQPALPLGGRTNDERVVAGFIRPAWAKKTSLKPHFIDTVQHAVRTSAFNLMTVLRTEGKRISDPNGRMLREASNQRWADAAGASLDAIELAAFQLREAGLTRLALEVHGQEIEPGGKHRKRGLHAGQRRVSSVHELVKWKDWIDDDRAFALHKGKHVTLGCGERVGAWKRGATSDEDRWIAVFTDEDMAEWHIGDEQGGLKAAADAGAASKAAAAGDVIAAAAPPAEKFDFPPRREGVGEPPEVFAALNTWLPGTGHKRALQFVDAIARYCGEVATGDLVQAINVVGQRIRDRGKAASSPEWYFLKALVNHIRAGPEGESPPIDAWGYDEAAHAEAQRLREKDDEIRRRKGLPV